MKTRKEIWVDVKGHEGLYMVSNTGQVKSLPRIVARTRKTGKTFSLKVCGVIMRHDINNQGYLTIHLHKDGKRKKFYISRLVAAHFIPNPENKKEVNHIDSNPKNNDVSNLEWVTPSENMKHCFRVGRSNILQIVKRSYSNSQSKPVRQLTKEGEFIKLWHCTADAARSINQKSSCILNAIKGKQKTCGGYRWDRIIEANYCKPMPAVWHKI